MKRAMFPENKEKSCDLLMTRAELQDILDKKRAELGMNTVTESASTKSAKYDKVLIHTASDAAKSLRKMLSAVPINKKVGDRVFVMGDEYCSGLIYVVAGGFESELRTWFSSEETGQLFSDLINRTGLKSSQLFDSRKDTKDNDSDRPELMGLHPDLYADMTSALGIEPIFKSGEYYCDLKDCPHEDEHPLDPKDEELMDWLIDIKNAQENSKEYVFLEDNHVPKEDLDKIEQKLKEETIILSSVKPEVESEVEPEVKYYEMKSISQMISQKVGRKVSSQEANLQLKALGFQVKKPDAKKWEVTNKGDKYSAPLKKIKWSKKVVELICDRIMSVVEVTVQEIAVKISEKLQTKVLVKEVNQVLRQLGLQVKGEKKGSYWTLTEEGKKIGRFNTRKIFWSDKVLEILLDYFTQNTKQKLDSNSDKIYIVEVASAASTKLNKRLSVRRVNEILASMNLQLKPGKNKLWKLTEKGKAIAAMEKNRIKWDKSVIERLCEALKNSA
ncbi:MAG: hypothetical protein F6K10_04900 [Moorea sp. SIO2B7]|nr:hypothetical protein [Moorena sp. SIO2B7]